MFTMLAAAKTVIQGIPMSHISIGLSAYVLLVALSAFYKPKKFREAIHEFLNSGSAIIRIGAILCFFIAFIILNTHWTVKVWSDRSIMTVLGYLIVLKGIILFLSPDLVRRMANKILQTDKSVYIVAVVSLIIGLGTGYLGIWIY